MEVIIVHNEAGDFLLFLFRSGWRLVGDDLAGHDAVLQTDKGHGSETGLRPQRHPQQRIPSWKSH